MAIMFENALASAQLEQLPAMRPIDKYTLFRETYPEFIYDSY